MPYDISIKDGIVIGFMLSLWFYSIYLIYQPIAILRKKDPTFYVVAFFLLFLIVSLYVESGIDESAKI